MRRASDTTSGAAESYADVVRQRPAAGGPRKRLRLLATFGGRMHSSDWSRLLTERQREVLSIVVENKVYRNRDSKIPELAAQMGIAPAAVAKHLLEIEKTALLNVVVSPSEQGKRVYERLELEPRPEQKQTAEVLDPNTVTILRFLHVHPDASTTEVAEELGLSEYTTVNGLRAREEWIAQRVIGAKCIAPNGTWFYITRLPGYAIHRPAFDRWLVDGAVDDGAELRTSTKVTGISRHDGGWRIEANGETIDARVIIGADGPASFVARQAGLVRSLERIGAYEYRFRREDVPLREPEFVLLYIGEAYQGGYAWIFPKGDSVNVGAGGHIDAHAATVDFCRKFGIDVDRRTQTIAGSIPSRYDLTSLGAPGLAIAGDAAGITNPLNGAGIHSGIFSGRLAGEFAVTALTREHATSMVANDRAMRASPFLDPLLSWMIDRILRWGDRP